jgi:uncharacterized membrane protein
MPIAVTQEHPAIMPFATRPSTRSIVVRALLLGIAAGMRSNAPLGTFARHQLHAPRAAGWARWPVLRSGFGRALLQLAWIGEFFGDKLPSTPSRLERRSLGSRITLGTIAGLAAGTEGRGAAPRIGGAIAGAVGAVAGSFGGYHTRKFAAQASGLPDPAVAVVEDLTAAAISKKAVLG